MHRSFHGVTVTCPVIGATTTVTVLPSVVLSTYWADAAGLPRLLITSVAGLGLRITPFSRLTVKGVPVAGLMTGLELLHGAAPPFVQLTL
jgi:hypothetical protein